MVAELDALLCRPHGSIDLDGMPEVTDWPGAIRGRLCRTEAFASPPAKNDQSVTTLAALCKMAAA